MNTLPIELIDLILQYDGRIKYRNGIFINTISYEQMKIYNELIQPIIHTKKEALRCINTAHFGLYLNLFKDSDTFYCPKRFYFEVHFEGLHNVGLCYDFYWGRQCFQICYYDLRHGYWEEIRTIID
jgi:hypothetical protein